MSGAISQFLKQRIDAGDFPSAVYLVAEKGEIVMQDALGLAVVEPKPIQAQIDTIYDVASLTKVLATGLIAAIAVENKNLNVSDTLSKYLPISPQAVLGQTTVRHVLSHTTGLPAWRPLYLLSDLRNEISDLIAHEIRHDPIATVVYSDLNFILLGKILEDMYGKALDEIFVDEICGRLGLRRTFFNPEQNLLDHIAANEKGNVYERQMCIEQGYTQSVANAAGSDYAVRDHVIWGEVHDGNAYFMGGVAGHAGLFSTAEEVFRIAQQFLLRYTELLKPGTSELFRTNFTPGIIEHRSFAFQLASSKDSTAGSKMSPESFGHNGFTGTSLWIDPVKERVFVLLTNRTHNHGLPFVNINSVRRRFHDLAIDILDKN